MKKKIHVQFISIAAIAIVTTMILSVATFYELFQRQVMEDLRSYAYVLKEMEAQREIDREEINYKDSHTRVTLINSDGSVEFDSDADAEKMENHADRPEVIGALKDGEGESIRRSETLDKNTFYYAVRLPGGQVLRAAKEAGSIWSVFVGVLPVIGIISLMIFVVCVVLARVLTKSLIKPIEQMAGDIENMNEIETYPELLPFMTMIHRQHQDIMKNAKMRQEFTANVSHELKTPLTSISGYSELIETGMASEEDVERFAREIHNNSSRLLTLINDILRLSELDVEDMSVAFTMVNLYQLAESCMGMLQLNAEQHEVTLSLEGEPCTIYANRQMMEELIYNLCDNAIRYNNPRGSVVVRLKKGKDETMLSVRDTGIGIPIQHQERVFERFYRVDKSRSKSTGGTGLGLAIVKHIVAQHHARMELDSEYGRGTEIRVYFPNKQNPGWKRNEQKESRDS